jgi:arginine-glutamic acid dipeptide repeats protein
MDEGESNSEPPESMILLSKEGEEKDPLLIALPETPSSDTQTKDDHVDNDQRSPSDVATPDDEADIPAQSSKIAPEEDGEKEKKASADEQKANDIEPVKDVKEQEMLSKLANMKQEVSLAAPIAASEGEFQSKEPVFIKKEPSEEVAQDTLPNQNPTDLKVKVEVKSEAGKSGSNNAPSDNSNQMPNEQDNNNNAENLVCKPLQKFAAGPPSIDGSLQPKTPENRPEGADYSMKSFIERDGVKVEQQTKEERSPDGPKSFVNERDQDAKFPPEHAPPGMLRHPFDPMLKFDPMKYELPHPGMDLKYLPPDHPARAYAEGALKSQFSADNLIKGSAHYPPDMKYPPIPPPTSTANDTPLDVSSRITPNQDSQGSNSNSQPATLPSPSPLSSQPSLIPSFVGHPGLNLSGHLPANHPSLMSSSGPPMGASSLPPTSGSSPFLPIQGGLHRPEAISSGSRTFPTSTSTTVSASLSSGGSAFGPGPGNPLYATSRLENHREGLHRTSPLGPLLHGSPHPLLSHPLPLHHLGHPGIGISHHHPGHLPPHLHNHLMQPLGPNTPLPLIGGPQPSSNPLSSLIEAAGRGTPTSAPSSMSHMPPSSQHNSVIQSPSAPSSLNSSSLSRTSPLVHPSAGGAFSHRPQSPSSNHPANLSRNSPLHLGGQPLGPSPAAISAERERQLMRQQSPHMTPPPVSAASNMVSSPLSKMYGPPGSQQRQNSPPPQHFRPGASPPVNRHPSMPLAMPLLQSPVMHPSQSPYPHHLLHPSMFYAAHNPFNSPYPYSAYGPPPGAYSYIKGGGPLDPGALMQHHHPTSIPPPRSDEPPSPHSNGPKSVTSMHDKIKSPAPSKSSQNSNHSGSNPSTPSGLHPGGPYSSPYPPSHPFMENTLPPGKTSHIEALRAHAASAAGMGPGSHHHPTEPVHIEAVEIEPDPEPPSPVHPIDRGPSPEAKPDDTECHRSQSAM